jgi:hypothetical protein
MIMHRKGINLRYLGLIRRHANGETIEKFLLTEMIARVLKHHLRKELREKNWNRLSQNYHVNEVIRENMNIYFANSHRSNSNNSFWNIFVKPELSRRYEGWEKNDELIYSDVYLTSLIVRISDLGIFL